MDPFIIESTPVTAPARRLKTRWSEDVAQALMRVHGMVVPEEVEPSPTIEELIGALDKSDL